MTHEIVQKFLKGENDAGGTIHALELEIERLQKRIAELEAAQQSVQRTAGTECDCGNPSGRTYEASLCWDCDCRR